MAILAGVAEAVSRGVRDGCGFVHPETDNTIMRARPKKLRREFMIIPKDQLTHFGLVIKYPKKKGL